MQFGVTMTNGIQHRFVLQLHLYAQRQQPMGVTRCTVEKIRQCSPFAQIPSGTGFRVVNEHDHTTTIASNTANERGICGVVQRICAMFSSLFGGRGGGRAKGAKAAAKEAAKEAAAAAKPTVGEAERMPGARPETLQTVIETQRVRCAQCQRHAEKAEHRRDNLLASAEVAEDADEAEHLNEAAAEQEALRKAKTDMCIKLQEQISVLERVAAESGLRSQGLDEDLDAAAARQEKEEEGYYIERKKAEDVREKNDEVNLLMSQNTFEPSGDLDANSEIQAFQEAQAV